MNNPLLTGFVVGVVFGALNLIVTWLDPLLDDNPATLLAFYGPMFFVWGLVAFRAARRTGRFLSAVAASAVVAFATFVAYDVLILIRVNLFFDELTGRADWQNMVARFRESGSDSLRMFVNLEYIKGSPFRIAVASIIGGAIGTVAGSLGRLLRRRIAI